MKTSDYFKNAEEFIVESLNIEGIHRPPTLAEIVEYDRFMNLERVTVEELEKFVKVYQPKAKLRDQAGINVRVGDFHPIAGGPVVKSLLMNILENTNPYKVHKDFETLHPFTDCNGRAGRMLWMWMMREAPLGFLHHWYYQSLNEGRK